MKFLDFFRMGLVNLSRRKARTILTALSMAIGVMCIVVLISVGLGYEAAYRENIEAMGSLTKIDVTPPIPRAAELRFSTTRQWTLLRSCAGWRR